MKRLHLISAVIVFGLLTGCATLNQSDSYLLQEHHVSPALYDRMNYKEYLTLSDIIELSQRQLPPKFIVHYLWSTYGVYHLSIGDVSRLRKAGVGKEVIDYLKTTESMYAPRRYPYYPRPAYPYDPYYDPYPYYPYGYYGYGYPTVIVGGGYGGYGHHWH